MWATPAFGWMNDGGALLEAATSGMLGLPAVRLTLAVKTQALGGPGRPRNGIVEVLMETIDAGRRPVMTMTALPTASSLTAPADEALLLPSSGAGLGMTCRYAACGHTDLPVVAGDTLQAGALDEPKRAMRPAALPEYLIHTDVGPFRYSAGAHTAEVGAWHVTSMEARLRDRGLERTDFGQRVVLVL